MSHSFNKVILIGHAGGAAEQRSDTFATFSLATNKRWKDASSGEWKERTDWHRVSAFGKRADLVIKHVEKGIPLLIEGELRTDSYEYRGERRQSTFVELRSFRKLPTATPRQVESISQGADDDLSDWLDEDAFPF